MTPNWMILKKEKDKQKKFFLRAKIISLIRNFFCRENFLEVETPSLVRLPGMEPHLDPVKVNFSILGGKREAYLTTSPEYAMKKILAAGFSRIFQICKSFRGGEAMDDLHNPEFTILEWYRTNADYKDIMDDAEKLITFIGVNLQNKKRLTFPKKIKNLKIKYQGKIIDLTPPWPKLTIRDAFSKYAGIDLDKVLERNKIVRVAKDKGYVISKNDSFDDIFFKIFLSEIEPHLGQEKPTILYDWPVQMAALSRQKKTDPRYAERFEIYIGGLELGNAFSELIDSGEQRRRLVSERNLRKELGKEIYDIDEDFLEALREMPPSGGIAMGVDRIAMLFADAKSIDEVMFFTAKQIL
ncbi:EF-P lysine aminoacylase GenX [Candidatus Falkowbacteria bacterium]|nr:EF-P lysine aminoacylase GenX [Candidatus Falkowbacteria bacterium]